MNEILKKNFPGNLEKKQKIDSEKSESEKMRQFYQRWGNKEKAERMEMLRSTEPQDEREKAMWDILQMFKIGERINPDELNERVKKFEKAKEIKKEAEYEKIPNKELTEEEIKEFLKKHDRIIDISGNDRKDREEALRIDKEIEKETKELSTLNLMRIVAWADDICDNKPNDQKDNQNLQNVVFGIHFNILLKRPDFNETIIDRLIKKRKKELEREKEGK